MQLKSVPAAGTVVEAEPEHQMQSAGQGAGVQLEVSSVKAGSETDSDLARSEFFVHSI